MLFFWWKKYEGAWWASQISFVGTLFITVTAIMLGALVKLHFSSVPEWVIIVIVAVIFSILKYLLNRLTDRIANRTIEKEANEQKRWATTANVTLQTPSSLTIIRDSSPVAALVPTIIYLNNTEVASIKNGESVTIPIKMRNNLLQTNAVVGLTGRLERYEFAVQDGARGTIHVKGGIFDKKNVVWH